MAKKRNVYLGLSGGVDSSVAAALLLEQGYNVVPVFIKCWENEVLGECPWREDQDAAYAVAEKLGVTKQFRSWNFEREFFQDVVQYLVEEAKRGRTGNPDVVCNRTIKFGVFLDRALAEGADFVATGHYARVRGTEDGVQLLRPKCEWKNDQTYFLWQLTQKQLRQVMFPVGEFTSKDLVREEARRPVGDRRLDGGVRNGRRPPPVATRRPARGRPSHGSHVRSTPRTRAGCPRRRTPCARPRPRSTRRCRHAGGAPGR